MNTDQLHARIRKESEKLLKDTPAMQVITIVITDDGITAETSSHYSKAITAELSEAAAKAVLHTHRAIAKRQHEQA